jgi:hypothetical protein
MLRIEFVNDGTGPDSAANYRVAVLVNGKVVDQGRVTDHYRESHWTVLLARTVQQLGTPEAQGMWGGDYLARDAARLRNIVRLLQEDAVVLQRDLLARVEWQRQAEAKQREQDEAVGHLCALHAAHLEAEVKRLQQANEKAGEHVGSLMHMQRVREQELAHAHKVIETLRATVEGHGHRT